MFEVVRGGALRRRRPGVAFMLDQCHNIEAKIPGQIRSVLNVQEMTAKALLVDADALAAAQQAGDVLGANGVLMDAFYTDVRPLLRRLASELGPAPGPDGRLRRVRLRASGSWPSGSAAPRPGGAPERAGSDVVRRRCSSASNRLGADPRNTNYAGGNTSAKGTATDPVTGETSSCCGSRAPAATSAR